MSLCYILIFLWIIALFSILYTKQMLILSEGNLGIYIFIALIKIRVYVLILSEFFYNLWNFLVAYCIYFGFFMALLNELGESKLH